MEWHNYITFWISKSFGLGEKKIFIVLFSQYFSQNEQEASKTTDGFANIQ